METLMGETSIDESRIKDLIKQAMLEVLQERRDLISELFAEAIEDLGLTQAIREGESTESVSRDEVIKALEGTA